MDSLRYTTRPVCTPERSVASIMEAPPRRIPSADDPPSTGDSVAAEGSAGVEVGGSFAFPTLEGPNERASMEEKPDAKPKQKAGSN